jgi:hypothetical protein
MPWDRERYRRDVLEPARQAGNVLPADLYLRYGVPAGVSDTAAFDRRVAEVVAYWRELDRQGRYQQLARALRTAHRELERAGPLTPGRFAEHQRQARQRQAAQLARLAEVAAGEATHVGPDTVRRIAAALDIPASDGEITEALGQAGVRVVAGFPDLPGEPHPKQADLARYVQQLGKRLSTEVVFGDSVRDGFRILGGFRLGNGTQLDERALDNARDRAAALPYTDAATAPIDNVLAILGAAARQPGQLDALLLSEVVERLRQFAGLGFLQRGIAVQAHDLGLDQDEAGLLAGAVLTRGTAAPLRQRIEEALRSGALRAAQREAAGFPSGDPIRERIAVQDAKVASLSREADQELAEGRRELAAARLAEALRMARDDSGLAERLTALPPPAPRHADASMDGTDVRVTWEPSAALAGPVRYRVRRGEGRPPHSPADGVAVPAPEGWHEVIDTEAPVGTDLFYSVFADRGGEACSPAAVSRAVARAPDVTGVTVTVAETSAAVSWRAPVGADSVQVVRTTSHEPRGPDDGTPVEASLTGFSDAGLRTGTDYCYRITVSYRGGDGQRRQSAGIVVSAVPAPEPDAVTDLEVTVAGNGVPAVLATWLPPRHGHVRLVVHDAPPPWPTGARITPTEAAGSREVAGAPMRGSGGRDCLPLNLPAGRHYVCALTWQGNAVVVGNTVLVALVEPVRGLTAQRTHDALRLAWEWPAGATDAVTRWADQEHRCSWRSYHDEGGVTVTIGPAETLIEVRALYPDPGGPLLAPAASVTVPARGVAVHYRIRRGSIRHPRRRTVEFLPERAVRLPAIVVVQTAGQYVPDDPDGGETLARAEPRDAGPDRRTTVSVDVRRGPGWLACFVAPDVPAADAAAILLFHPPAAEMRIR